MLKNVSANSFALTSRLSCLPSAAGPVGQGLREHPVLGSSSPALLPCTVHPWHLWAQLSFLLAGNESKRGLDPRLFRDLPAASAPSGCVPACIPAIWQLLPAGPVHPPACLGWRKWEQAGISPRHLLRGPECRVQGPPSALELGGWSPCTLLACRAPPEGPPPPDLPLLRVFSHV